MGLAPYGIEESEETKLFIKIKTEIVDIKMMDLFLNQNISIYLWAKDD